MFEDIARQAAEKVRQRANGHAEEHDAGGASPALTPITAAELLARELPPRRMLLVPVLPERGLVMLYAPRGMGKTYVALSIAYAVAAGGGLFAWSTERPRKVMLIDGEMPACTLQERLACIVQGFEQEPPSPDHLRVLAADLHEDGLPDLADPQGQAAVEAAMGDAHLLVLDNLSSLIRSGRENEADSWQPVQDWLLRLRRRGVSVLLVHHAGKGGQQRGTSRREDLLDTIIALRRPEDYQPREGARFEVHIEKARGVVGAVLDPFEALLEVRDGASIWTTKSIEDAALARVIAMSNEKLSVRDIAEETGLSKSQVNRLQRRAREEGKIIAFPKRGGKGGRRLDGGEDD